jgi:hypothetical protein
MEAAPKQHIKTHEASPTAALTVRHPCSDSETMYVLAPLTGFKRLTSVTRISASELDHADEHACSERCAVVVSGIALTAHLVDCHRLQTIPPGIQRIEPWLRFLSLWHLDGHVVDQARSPEFSRHRQQHLRSQRHVQTSHVTLHTSRADVTCHTSHVTCRCHM